MAVVALPALSTPLRAQVQGPRCNGTVLHLTVQERGDTRTDRFRFLLRLEAEGSKAAAALEQLNGRLARVRTELRPLVQGDLEVPAPNASALSSLGVRIEARSDSHSTQPQIAASLNKQPILNLG